MDVYILLHNTTLHLDDTEKAWYSISTCTYMYEVVTGVVHNYPSVSLPSGPISYLIWYFISNITP